MATACPPLSLQPAYLPGRSARARRPLPAVRCSAVGEVMAETPAVGTVEEPLLVSAIEGEEGRETAGLAYEAGREAILFSDILTLLPGMNIPFDIVKGKGPVIFDPLRTAAAVNEVREFVPEEWVPYVGQALNILREEGSDTHCFLLRLTMKLPC
uniref:Uroporphyrinogen decarboxylase (URO-D) domain-containing protein n=1 Tax=Oryza glumipatula TaxID=40148 RepID=A0A0D9Z727_9ORYZ